MIALGLALGLFAYWMIVGFAVLSVLYAPDKKLRNLLLSPTVGAAVTVVPVFLLSRVGVPVAQSGPIVFVLLTLVSGGLLAWSRPRVAVREYAPFAAVFVLALWLTGRPMLEFGFDWVSYANEDMANYALGAHFFLHNGFPGVPDVSRLVNGSDYSLFYWFFYVPNAVRPGSELVLAWLISITGLNGHQAYMPLILALHVTLVSVAAALVYGDGTRARAAWTTALLVSLSALTTLGAVAQLVAQVNGLGLLAATALILQHVSDVKTWRDAVRHGVLVGILIAALLIVYPEVVPFLGLAFTVQIGVRLVRQTIDVRVAARVYGVASGTALLLINTYVIDVALFMYVQLTGGLRPGNPNDFIFPYFLIPSGLATFWGLQTIHGSLLEPLNSVTILIGAALLLLAFVLALMLTWRGYTGPTVAAVMLVFAMVLFVRSSDFGIFKLALFVQPFVLGVLALGLVRQIGRAISWRVAPLALVVAAGVVGQYSYVERSRGQFNEIPLGSQARINADFEAIVAGVQPQHLVLDTMNISLAKFQALYTRGIDVAFPSRDFFSYLLGREAGLVVPGTAESARRARAAVDSRLVTASFALHDAADASRRNEFTINTLGHTDSIAIRCDAFVSTTGTQSIFNRLGTLPDSAVFSAQSCSDVHNHLIFVHSTLGEHYYRLTRDDHPSIAIFGLEPDPFFTGRTMSGMGRHLLMEVVGASPSVRLALEMTSTLKADSENALPRASAIGNERVSFPLVGRGSARVYSPPLTPQVVLGRMYVAIDMGVDGRRFPDQRAGLMFLYGTTVPLDGRELVAFGRNISLIASDRYEGRRAPSLLRQFPADLQDPNLEYSGMYEDGWIADAAYFRLAQPPEAMTLAIQGMVPQVQDPTITLDLEILVDGQPVARKTLGLGEFDVSAQVPPGSGIRRVDVRFSRLQRLVAPDTRPVAALLRAIGFSAR